MTEKRPFNLRFINAAAIIRYPDQGQSAIFDLDSNCVCSGIYGILHKLLYHTGRPLNNFSCRNLINCALT